MSADDFWRLDIFIGRLHPLASANTTAEHIRYVLLAVLCLQDSLIYAV